MIGINKVKYIIALAVIIIISIVSYRCGNSKVKVEERKVIERKIDTIKVEIAAKEKQVIKYVDKVKYLQNKKIIYDTIICKEIVANKDSIIAYKDTIIAYKDTIIYKEREIINYKHRIIYNSKKDKTKRLGVGINAGYGITNNNLSPYIGVGISYNLFNF